MKESRMKLVSQVKTFSVVFFKAIDSRSLLPASSLGWYHLCDSLAQSPGSSDLQYYYTENFSHMLKIWGSCDSPLKEAPLKPDGFSLISE